jgi:hypothetical protein
MNPCSSDAFGAVDQSALRSLEWSYLSSEEEITVWVSGGPQEDGERTPRSRSGPCKAWAAQRKRYKTVECDTKLPVFCQSDLKSKLFVVPPLILDFMS